MMRSAVLWYRRNLAPLSGGTAPITWTIIPSDEIVLVTIGKYALAACRHLLFGDGLIPPKITEYIREHGEPQSVYFSVGGKRTLIHFTAFLHPSNRNRIISQYDLDGKIAENERKQEKFLKDFVTV